MAYALGTPPELSPFGGEAKNYLLLLGLTWFLGLCVAGLVGWVVLGTLYQYRAELNGYPFQVGDRVQILVGTNRGRIATVIEVWEWRGDLHVDLAEFARPRARTRFHFAQIVRVPDGEKHS